MTDGTSGETIKAGAFRAFRERLRDLAYDASKRANGKYEPIRRVDLILLGDILDVIRSTEWLTGKIKPWSSAKTQSFQKKIGAITEAILKENKESLDCLKSLQEPNVITIPEATSQGSPKTVGRDPDASDRVQVDVHVHYMVGNHDWFYHLAGAPFNRIRRKIVKAIGLSNPPDDPFPHDPNESEEISGIFRQHQVFARHGDIFDPWNFEGDRNASSLGDAIVVELLNRFPAEVRKLMGQMLPRECLDGLKELDNVRPLPVIPAWIGGLLRRTCPDLAQAKRVKEIWNDLADQFLKLTFVRDRDKWFQTDLVDELELGLKLSKGFSLRSLDRLVGWWNSHIGGGDKPFYHNALSERDFKNRRARYIVYGHTHRHEVVPLDSCVVAERLFNQTYINSGTWRRVHERARLEPEDQEFLGHYVMTYLAFFKDDERNGQRFESWSGALGGAPAAVGSSERPEEI